MEMLGGGEVDFSVANEKVTFSCDIISLIRINDRFIRNFKDFGKSSFGIKIMAYHLKLPQICVTL